MHAKGQVASFVTHSVLPVETFPRGANALLPPDVSVQAAADVSLEFDPRRHALSRWYRYTMHLGPQRPALLRDFTWHLAAKHDLDAMAEAAAGLVGRHDFAAFTQPSEARRRRTEREVSRAVISRQGELALFDIEANAYLPQMVRRIVGALSQVGSGKRPKSEFEAFVRKAQPGAAGFVAPASGLCLMKVRYENELFEIAPQPDVCG